MSSLSKMLSVLDLFSGQNSHITPRQVQDELDLTRATAYRYLKALTDAGLLARFGGEYMLGARAIELDYLIRRSDPLLTASESILANVSTAHDCDLQLISLSGNRLLVTSHVHADKGLMVSYGRGMTMPVLKGAGGRVILAGLSPSRQKALIAGARGIPVASLDPEEWSALHESLAAIRREGHAISDGELDIGNVGIAVPIEHGGLEYPAALVMIMARNRFALADRTRIVALLHDTVEQIRSAFDRIENKKTRPPSPPGTGREASRAAPPIGLGRDLAGASPDQQRIIDLITSGPRGTVPSPFLAMLDAPKLADAIQQVGAVLRFSSTLSDAVREIAILATAGAVGCGYEWNYHAPIAEAAHVSAQSIAATRPGASSEGADDPDAIVIELCRAVVRDGEAPAFLLAAASARLGREGATELVAIAGYYAMLANFIKSAGFDEPFRPG